MVNPVFSKNSKLHYRLRQLGWQGAIGLIFIAASILLQLFITNPNAKKMDGLMISLAELQAKVTAGQVEAKPDSQFDVVAKLNALTPKQGEANKKIAQILHTATETGLSTDKVDYAAQSYSTSLIKYQIKLPTQGSYIQIRQFLNSVLNALPTVALTDIKLKREDIGSDLIDAHIQFNLYVRKNENG
jgi:hypothetical protein